MNIVFGRALLGVPDPRGRARTATSAARAAAPLRHRVVRGLEGRHDRPLDPDRDRLSLVFDPTSTRGRSRSRRFAIAIWGAYLLRTMLQDAGACSASGRRVARLFDLYMTAELLLSGRLVPLPLMPDWVQDSRVPSVPVGVLLPIESLVGDLSNEELDRRPRRAAPLDPHRHRDLPRGWRFAIKRYSAVGG